MRLAHRFSLPGRSLALAGLMLLGVAAVPLSSSAHFIGGSWAYSGGLLPLSYQNNAGGYPSYANAINTAASDWYFTPTPSDLYSVGGAANITLNTFSDANQGYWGVTQIWASHQHCIWFFGNICWWSNDEINYGDYPNVTGLGAGWGNYQSSTISLNRAQMDGLS